MTSTVFFREGNDRYAASFTRQKDRLTGFDQWRQAI